MSKKGKIIPLQPISLKTYIIERARKLPIYKCWSIGNDESGMKQIIVSRQKANGKLIVGFYLIDSFCLGLKDTFYREFEDEDEVIEALSDAIFDEIDFEEIDANYAQNFIYGGIEYAEDLGFTPAKDFNITEYLLDEVDDIEYIDIEFGKNGKPFYVPGENDDIEKNLKILENNVGSGNFEYSLSLLEDFDDDDDFDEELDELEDLDEEEIIEKTKEIIENISDERIKALFILHFGILVQINKVNLDVDELLEEYQVNREGLVSEIRANCIENLPVFEIFSDDDGSNTVITVLLEQYIYHEGIHFVLHSDYQKALTSFINEEFSTEQFHLLTPFETKTLFWAMEMLDEIAQFLFKIDSFRELNVEQKNKAINYFITDINNDEASDISDDYKDFWGDFRFFNKEYKNWNEDELKLRLLEL
jgi:hypothetical protein